VRLSPEFAGWSIIATLVFSYLIKMSLGDAFAMTAIIATYYRETRNLTPDPSIVAKLDSISDKFKNLKQRAAEAIVPSDREPANNKLVTDALT